MLGAEQQRELVLELCESAREPLRHGKGS
jgi:hypothetical protein